MANNNISKTKSRDVTESIKKEVWILAAGRCCRCNKLVYINEFSKQKNNEGEVAHIYAFANNGPRKAVNNKKTNTVENLMLLCLSCHNEVDSNEEQYSAEYLQKLKIEHEARIRLVTEIKPSQRSHIIIYKSIIGDMKANIPYNTVAATLFPEYYPAQYEPIDLSSNTSLGEKDAVYWKSEAENLKRTFNTQIEQRLQNMEHITLFAFAPIPLLILLGTLFTDRYAIDVRQRIRATDNWRWLDTCPDANNEFKLEKHGSGSNIAILFSLSDKVHLGRVTSVIRDELTILEVTIDQPNNDFMKHKIQLKKFNIFMRDILRQIGNEHPNSPIHIFPAMPISCAIELGRVRMPKVSSKWFLYDTYENNLVFHKVLEL